MLRIGKQTSLVRVDESHVFSLLCSFFFWNLSSSFCIDVYVKVKCIQQRKRANANDNKRCFFLERNWVRVSVSAFNNFIVAASWICVDFIYFIFIYVLFVSYCHPILLLYLFHNLLLLLPYLFSSFVILKFFCSRWLCLMQSTLSQRTNKIKRETRKKINQETVMKNSIDKSFVVCFDTSFNYMHVLQCNIQFC